MRLPWTKKAAQPDMQAKSASWMVGMAALRQMTLAYNAFAAEGYGLNPVANACIDKTAKSVSSVDLVLYNIGATGKRTKIDGAHPIKKLLFDSPNPGTSGHQFLDSLVRYRLIGGNAYVLGTGFDPKNAKSQPKELYLLNPAWVTVKNNPNGQFPLQYEYAPSGGVRQIYPVDPITGRSQILHSKTFNPIDPWLGMSPMSACAFEIDVFNEGQKWNLRLLQNECRPSGALTVKSSDGNPASLSPEQYSRLTDQINQQFSGSNNAGRPLLLEGGMEWTSLSMTQKDMDHKENILNAARFIASVYGVPPMLVNVPGEATFANFEQARLALWTDTVLPLLSMICEEFNRWLVPAYGGNLEVWYDEEMIPALEPLRSAKAKRITDSNYLTTNEKRRSMGEDDVEGGDAVLVSYQNIPLDLIDQSTRINLAEPGSAAAGEASPPPPNLPEP